MLKERKNSLSQSMLAFHQKIGIALALIASITISCDAFAVGPSSKHGGGHAARSIVKGSSPYESIRALQLPDSLASRVRRGFFSTLMAKKKSSNGSDDMDFAGDDLGDAFIDADLAGGEWEPDDEDLKDLEDVDIDDVSVEDEDDDLEDDSTLVMEDDEELGGDEDDEDEYEWADEDDEDDEDEEDEPFDYEADEEAGWEVQEIVDNTPLQDDPDDPDYMAQKKIIEETIARREKVAVEANFDPIDYLANNLTPELREKIESTDMMQYVSKMEQFLPTMEDVEKLGDIDEAIANTPHIRDDVYEPTNGDPAAGARILEANGVTDAQMIALDEAERRSHEALQMETKDKLNMEVEDIWGGLSNETKEEIAAVLFEIDTSAYNCTKWVIYDEQFNVSNLVFAAIKHSPDAPIIFSHWYPQLIWRERYQHVRDRNFEFTLDDIENADISELERYYKGFGYDEIPMKYPGETGVIEIEEVEDDEEIKQMHFDKWIKDVYNPYWETVEFDDEDILDVNNAFSNFFVPPRHPDLPTYEEAKKDVNIWKFENSFYDNLMTPEQDAYRKKIADDSEYTVDDDPDFEKNFRGHLVVACGPWDDDLDVAEKITARMEKDFGNSVYVETRVYNHAMKENNVFEIWMESYEIELLFSRKRSTSNNDDWDGPSICGDAEIDILAEQVGFMISEDSRLSTPYHMEYEV